MMRLQNLRSFWERVVAAVGDRGIRVAWPAPRSPTAATTILSRAAVVFRGAVLLLVGGVQVLAATTPEWEIVQAPKLISVGLPDFDVLTQRHRELNATFEFLDPQGKSIGQFAFNYTIPAARSHLLFEKKDGVAYHSVKIALRDGTRKLRAATLPIPASVTPSPTVTPSAEKAFVVPGTRTDPKTLPQGIVLPDYSKTHEVSLPDAKRRWNLEQSVKRVVADVNFPSMGSPNHSVISLQTAHPDDLTKRSNYLSTKSTLYNQETGETDSTLKYLAELPLDESWRLGDGDLDVTIPVEKLRVHITKEKLNDSPRALRITGEDSSGLMQGALSVTVDDEGNIYFFTPAELIRFNVKKARFEKPPVSVTEYANTFLPKPSDLPKSESGVREIRYYGYCMLFYGGHNRVFVSYADNQFRNDTLYPSALFSVPTTDWDNAEAFRKKLKLNAVGGPPSRFHLYPTWIPGEGEVRKMGQMYFIQDRIYLGGYYAGDMWAINVDEQGNTTRLVKLATYQGRPIKSLDGPRAVYGENGFLGIQINVLMKDNGESFHAFLGKDSEQLVPLPSEKIKRVVPESLENRAGAFIRPGTAVYGVRELSKEEVAAAFGKTDFGAGTVRIYYDILAWLRKNPKGIEDLIAQMAGPSLGPQFLTDIIPGEPGKIIGNSEYGGYYFAHYDCSSANGSKVKKEYFFPRRETPIDLPLGAGLGPYCHLWRHEDGDDWFYFAGYTGIARMAVRQNGKLLERTSVERIADEHESLDGAPPGSTKWYRDMIWGLGDKLYLTGGHQESRGGTAYAGGIGYLRTGDPVTLKRLAGMTSCHLSDRMDSRIVVSAEGKMTQQIYLPANFGITQKADEVPLNEAAKLFLYHDTADGEPEDRFGFSLATARDEKRSFVDFGITRNQLYGLVLLGDCTLVTIDLQTLRFVDSVRFTNRLQGFDRNVDEMNPMPDGNHLIVTVNEKDRSLTFHRVEVNAAGRIAIEPMLTCDVKSSGVFQDWKAGEFTWLADGSRNDGSYDFVLGSRYPRQEGARLLVIPDVIPPRNQNLAAKK